MKANELFLGLIYSDARLAVSNRRPYRNRYQGSQNSWNWQVSRELE